MPKEVTQLPEDKGPDHPIGYILTILYIMTVITISVYLIEVDRKSLALVLFTLGMPLSVLISRKINK